MREDPETRRSAPGGGSDAPRSRKLPPPAVPGRVRRTPQQADEAFIPPDAPIVRTSPPEPPKDFERVMTGQPGATPDAAGSATDHAGPKRFDDPAVADLVERVGTLADSLRQKGEAGLRATPEMSRFEATLRAYCVGYLAGLRRGD